MPSNIRLSSQNGERISCGAQQKGFKNQALTSFRIELCLQEKILLTADASLMSDYRKNEFLGFGACAPPNVIPDFLFKWMFYPHVETDHGVPAVAPYGLRKVEAQLLSEGFNVTTVAPWSLHEYLDGAKALGIHAMDPFGLGPASTTFASILKKESFLAQEFRAMLESPEVQKAKKRGLKIIVGGPGAWQFEYRREFAERYGIDCVLTGEAETVVGTIFRSALRGEKLPSTYESSVKETPSLEEIPDIVNPSVNALIEIGRGCCRGCQFCVTTLRPLRWYSLEKIRREISVNREKGKMNGVCLHAEDVMLYGSKNTLPNPDKLLPLHEMAVKEGGAITWSHCSLAAVASDPKLFAKTAEIVHEVVPWWGVEIGLETGSPELVKRIMPAKAHPFKPEEWRDVAISGMGLMHDNGLIPAATLIVGVPEETSDDLIKTLELMDELQGMRSIIVPLFFVPLGKLKDKEWFKNAEMTDLHKQLIIKCMSHDFRWLDKLIPLAFEDKWYKSIMQGFYRMFVRAAKHRAKRAGIRF